MSSFQLASGLLNCCSLPLVIFALFLFVQQVSAGIIKPLDSGFPYDLLLSGSNSEPLVVRSRGNDAAEPKVRLIPGVPSNYKSTDCSSLQNTGKNSRHNNATLNQILHSYGKYK
jgi:hypothetical protein